jgi:hypothetical protein
VIVENMPGASGLLGIRYVKSQPADGYTLLAGTGTVPIGPILNAEPGYELKDFTAVGAMNQGALVMVGTPNQPAKTLQEFIALAKQKPGEITFASGGVGTTTYLAASLFMHQAGIKLLHVPYKGTAAAMPDVLGGRVNMMFDAESSEGPQFAKASCGLLVCLRRNAPRIARRADHRGAGHARLQLHDLQRIARARGYTEGSGATSRIGLAGSVGKRRGARAHAQGRHGALAAVAR